MQKYRGRYAATRGSTGQEGSALVAAVVGASSLMVLSVALVQVSLRSEAESSSYRNQVEAQLLAETGLNEATASMKMDSTGALGSKGSPIGFAKGLFWSEATPLGEDHYVLNVTAMSGSGRSKIQARARKVLSATGGIDTLVYSDANLAVNKDAFFDSYDSTLGSYASQATNSVDGVGYASTGGKLASKERINVFANSAIFGDLLAEKVEFSIGAEDAHKAGSVLSAPADVSLLDLDLPTAPPSLGTLTVSGDPLSAGADAVIGPGELHYKTISFKKNPELHIVGPATIFIDNSLNVAGRLLIDDSAGPVTIVVGNGFNSVSSTVIDVLSGAARNFVLTSSGNQSFHVAGILTGLLYNPKGPVFLEHHAEVFGSIMCEKLSMKGAARLHFDEDLANFDLGLGGRPDFEIVSWRYVEMDDRELMTSRMDPFRLLHVQEDELLSAHEAWEKETSAYSDRETTSIMQAIGG